MLTLYRSDPFILVALCVAPLGWLLPPASNIPALWWILLTALAEEIIFRSTIQETLDRWLSTHFPTNKSALAKWKTKLPGTANIITSIIFAALHLFTHPPLWALSVFVPSLIYGLIWDRHKKISLCWMIHAAYNLCYFYQPL